MFPQPIQKSSQGAQVAYKAFLPVALFIWLLPLLAIVMTSIRPAADINQGNVSRVRCLRWAMATGIKASPAKAMRPIATSRAGNSGVPSEANSAIFIRMNELPQMKPRTRRASHMAASEVRMRMQN